MTFVYIRYALLMLSCKIQELSLSSALGARLGDAIYAAARKLPWRINTAMVETNMADTVSHTPDCA